MKTLDKLKEQFFEPTNQFRPVKLIHCHYPKESEEMDKFIQNILDNGIGGLVVQTDMYIDDITNPTQKQNYLNQETDKYLMDDQDWDKLKLFVEKCFKRGLRVWIYDECGYPSGNAGNWVYAKDNDFQVRGAIVQSTKTCGGKGSLVVEEGNIRMAGAYPRINDETISTKGMVKLYPQGNTINYDLPQGDWLVCAFVTKKINWKILLWNGTRQPLRVDLLRPDVVNTFIDVTHNKYLEKLGAENMSKIEAIFTDEPDLPCHGSFAPDKDSEKYPLVAWTDSFQREFLNRFGYDITQNLHCIFFNTDTDYKTVRRDYWKLVGDTFAHSYFKQIQDWCRRRKIKSTGHLYGEETLSMNIALNGDMFGLLRYMDMPGVDRLHGVDPRDVIPEKTASSVAHLMGHNQTMSESSFHFEKNMWNQKYTFSNMVNASTYQFMLGITNIASYYPLQDFKPEQNKLWGDYVARLAILMGQGKFNAPLLIHIPMTGARERYIPKDRKIWRVGPDPVAPYSCKEEQDLEFAYGKTQQSLLDNQWDYDLIDDLGLLQCNCNNGTISTKYNKYEAMVIFDSGYIDTDAYKSICKVLENGGNIIVCQLENNLSSQVENWVNQYPELIHITNVDNIVSTVDKLCQKPVYIKGEHPKIWVHHNTIDNLNILAIYNRDKVDDKINLKTIFNSSYTLMDPYTGEIQNISGDEQGNIELTVPGMRCVILVG